MHLGTVDTWVSSHVFLSSGYTFEATHGCHVILGVHPHSSVSFITQKTDRLTTDNSPCPPS